MIENYLFKEKKNIDMSKGIAISTILYFLLGIIVVGIIVYLVYTYTTGPQLSEHECRARIISWCTGCKVANWAKVGEITADSDVGKCILTYFKSSKISAPGNFPVNCNKTTGGSGGETKTYCEQFV